MNPAPPRFSVVVPTRGRPAQLARCLDALARLEYPDGHFEVIVVADGSAAVDVPKERPRPLALTVLDQDRRGPATARNAGAEQARGALLAFTDDDCAPDPDWLSRLEERLSSSPGTVVGGHTVNALPDNVYSSVSQLIIDALYEHFTSKSPGAFFTANNLALEAETFRSLGGFDESFPFPAGEDREFCDRCSERGVPLLYVPEAIVRHHHELNLRSFVRQHFTYGRGAVHFHRARFRRGLGRLVITPRFYSLLFRLPMARHGARGVALVALVAVAQLAYAAGLAREGVAGRKR